MNNSIPIAAGNVREFLAKSYETGLVQLGPNRRSTLPVVLGLAMAAVSSSMAHAATAEITNGTDPSVMIKNVCDFILGPFGQAIGVLGIIGVGMAWMFGRASMGLVAGVIGGIIIMFGAGFLGNTLMNTTG